MTKEAFDSGKEDEFLNRLREALNTAYQRLRDQADGFGWTAKLKLADSSDFVIKVFTDNIVIGYPCPDSRSSDGESELGAILDVLAKYQVGLAQKGFFIRGGIAYANHYMDEDVVFGDALREAEKLDKSGGSPRLTLAPSVLEMVQQHVGCYDRIESSPHHDVLLKDADGAVFLNYLHKAFAFFYDAGIFLELIEGHYQHICEELERYRGKPDIRAKYEWAAQYHNFVCREFAEAHPISYDPDADEVYGAACVQAQELKDYLIDVESFAAEPSRITTPLVSEQ